MGLGRDVAAVAQGVEPRPKLAIPRLPSELRNRVENPPDMFGYGEFADDALMQPSGREAENPPQTW